MTAIVLPLKVDGWPSIRILTKPTWSSKDAWTEQPMVQMAPKPVTRAGFEFLKCRRCTVDTDGFAVFRFVYGRMDKREYPAAPDLARYEVRILAQQNSDDDWTTIWWGTVEQQLEVAMSPSDDIPHGSREYHCLDGIAGRMRHWPLDRHGVYVSGGTQRPTAGTTTTLPCRGHPGYNHLRWDGRIAGTKETSGVIYDPWGDLTGLALSGRAFYHTFPGNGKAFTDKQAMETAIAEARPTGEVPFYIDGAIELLSAQSVWPVHEGMTCLDFLRTVLRRQRGRGLAYCDWEETGDPITGTFVPKISIRPQNLASIVYTPTGIDPNTGTAYTEITLRGATDYPSFVAIDLSADHRLGPHAESTYELGDRNAYAVQYLETQGEPIEVLITGAFDDTPNKVLEKRWEDAEATGFKAATVDARIRERYDSVYQLFGLSRDWDGRAGNGNVASTTRADFRCMDDGSIQVPVTSAIGDTSPLVVEVMRDLPLYGEYDYTVNYPSPRYDALTSDPYPPTRRAPLIMARVATTGTGKFMQIAPTPAAGLTALFTATFQISEYGISLFVPGDTASAVRTISDLTDTTLGAAINYETLVMTLGLRLPHHVRFASAATDPSKPHSDSDPASMLYTRETAPRRKTITHRNHHLWLAHVSAIWKLDETAYDGASGGYAAKRSVANGSDSAPGKIRDDRGALEQLHRLAWQWYGTDHQTASWQMHCCGLVPQFSSGDDGKSRTDYPRLGQTVSTLKAAGFENPLGTPISVVDYDHVKCLTRWATDWSDLDLR